MDWRNDVHLLTDLLPEPLRRFSLERWAASLGVRTPCRNTLIFLGVSTVLFHRAEKGHNPKVNDIWDALVYCSTCLSVGYGDVFARTPIGKIIGSTLMTLGPALSSRALDGPGQPTQEDTTQAETLATLKSILAELQKMQTPGQGPQSRGGTA
jgi:voltage-gated potassium channel